MDRSKCTQLDSTTASKSPDVNTTRNRASHPSKDARASRRRSSQKPSQDASRGRSTASQAVTGSALDTSPKHRQRKDKESKESKRGSRIPRATSTPSNAASQPRPHSKRRRVPRVDSEPSSAREHEEENGVDYDPGQPEPCVSEAQETWLVQGPPLTAWVDIVGWAGVAGWVGRDWKGYDASREPSPGTRGSEDEEDEEEEFLTPETASTRPGVRRLGGQGRGGGDTPLFDEEEQGRHTAEVYSGLLEPRGAGESPAQVWGPRDSRGGPISPYDLTRGRRDDSEFKTPLSASNDSSGEDGSYYTPAAWVPTPLASRTHVRTRSREKQTLDELSSASPVLAPPPCRTGADRGSHTAHPGHADLNLQRSHFPPIVDTASPEAALGTPLQPATIGLCLGHTPLEVSSLSHPIDGTRLKLARERDSSGTERSLLRSSVQVSQSSDHLVQVQERSECDSETTGTATLHFTHDDTPTRLHEGDSAVFPGRGESGSAPEPVFSTPPLPLLSRPPPAQSEESAWAQPTDTECRLSVEQAHHGGHDPSQPEPPPPIAAPPPSQVTASHLDRLPASGALPPQPASNSASVRASSDPSATCSQTVSLPRAQVTAADGDSWPEKTTQSERGLGRDGVRYLEGEEEVALSTTTDNSPAVPSHEDRGTGDAHTGVDVNEGRQQATVSTAARTATTAERKRHVRGDSGRVPTPRGQQESRLPQYVSRKASGLPSGPQGAPTPDHSGSRLPGLLRSGHGLREGRKRVSRERRAITSAQEEGERDNTAQEEDRGREYEEEGKQSGLNEGERQVLQSTVCLTHESARDRAQADAVSSRDGERPVEKQTACEARQAGRVSVDYVDYNVLCDSEGTYDGTSSETVNTISGYYYSAEDVNTTAHVNSVRDRPRGETGEEGKQGKVAHLTLADGQAHAGEEGGPRASYDPRYQEGAADNPSQAPLYTERREEGEQQSRPLASREESRCKRGPGVTDWSVHAPLFTSGPEQSDYPSSVAPVSSLSKIPRLSGQPRCGEEKGTAEEEADTKVEEEREEKEEGETVEREEEKQEEEESQDWEANSEPQDSHIPVFMHSLAARTPASATRKALPRPRPVNKTNLPANDCGGSTASPLPLTHGVTGEGGERQMRLADSQPATGKVGENANEPRSFEMRRLADSATSGTVHRGESEGEPAAECNFLAESESVSDGGAPQNVTRTAEPTGLPALHSSSPHPVDCSTAPSVSPPSPGPSPAPQTPHPPRSESARGISAAAAERAMRAEVMRREGRAGGLSDGDKKRKDAKTGAPSLPGVGKAKGKTARDKIAVSVDGGSGSTSSSGSTSAAVRDQARREEPDRVSHPSYKEASPLQSTPDTSTQGDGPQPDVEPIHVSRSSSPHDSMGPVSDGRRAVRESGTGTGEASMARVGGNEPRAEGQEGAREEAVPSKASRTGDLVSPPPKEGSPGSALSNGRTGSKVNGRHSTSRPIPISRTSSSSGITSTKEQRGKGKPPSSAASASSSSSSSKRRSDASGSRLSSIQGAGSRLDTKTSGQLQPAEAGSRSRDARSVSISPRSSVSSVEGSVASSRLSSASSSQRRTTKATEAKLEATRARLDVGSGQSSSSSSRRSLQGRGGGRSASDLRRRGDERGASLTPSSSVSSLNSLASATSRQSSASRLSQTSRLSRVSAASISSRGRQGQKTSSSSSRLPQHRQQGLQQQQGGSKTATSSRQKSTSRLQEGLVKSGGEVGRGSRTSQERSLDVGQTSAASSGRGVKSERRSASPRQVSVKVLDKTTSKTVASSSASDKGTTKSVADNRRTGLEKDSRKSPQGSSLQKKGVQPSQKKEESSSLNKSSVKRSPRHQKSETGSGVKEALCGQVVSQGVLSDNRLSSEERDTVERKMDEICDETEKQDLTHSVIIAQALEAEGLCAQEALSATQDAEEKKSETVILGGVLETEIPVAPVLGEKGEAEVDFTKDDSGEQQQRAVGVDAASKTLALKNKKSKENVNRREKELSPGPRSSLSPSPSPRTPRSSRSRSTPSPSRADVHLRVTSSASQRDSRPPTGQSASVTESSRRSTSPSCKSSGASGPKTDSTAAPTSPRRSVKQTKASTCDKAVPKPSAAAAPGKKPQQASKLPQKVETRKSKTSATTRKDMTNAVSDQRKPQTNTGDMAGGKKKHVDTSVSPREVSKPVGEADKGSPKAKSKPVVTKLDVHKLVTSSAASAPQRKGGTAGTRGRGAGRKSGGLGAAPGSPTKVTGSKVKATASKTGRLPARLGLNTGLSREEITKRVEDYIESSIGVEWSDGDTWSRESSVSKDAAPQQALPTEEARHGSDDRTLEEGSVSGSTRADDDYDDAVSEQNGCEERHAPGEPLGAKHEGRNLGREAVKAIAEYGDTPLSGEGKKHEEGEAEEGDERSGERTEVPEVDLAPQTHSGRGNYGTPVSLPHVQHGRSEPLATQQPDTTPSLHNVEPAEGEGPRPPHPQERQPLPRGAGEALPLDPCSRGGRESGEMTLAQGLQDAPSFLLPQQPCSSDTQPDTQVAGNLLPLSSRDSVRPSGHLEAGSSREKTDEEKQLFEEDKTAEGRGEEGREGEGKGAIGFSSTSQVLKAEPAAPGPDGRHKHSSLRGAPHIGGQSSLQQLAAVKTGYHAVHPSDSLNTGVPGHAHSPISTETLLSSHQEVQSHLSPRSPRCDSGVTIGTPRPPPYALRPEEGAPRLGQAFSGSPSCDTLPGAGPHLEENGRHNEAATPRESSVAARAIGGGGSQAPEAVIASSVPGSDLLAPSVIDGPAETADVFDQELSTLSAVNTSATAVDMESATDNNILAGNTLSPSRAITDGQNEDASARHDDRIASNKCDDHFSAETRLPSGDSSSSDAAGKKSLPPSVIATRGAASEAGGNDEDDDDEAEGDGRLQQQRLSATGIKAKPTSGTGGEGGGLQTDTAPGALEDYLQRGDREGMYKLGHISTWEDKSQAGRREAREAGGEGGGGGFGGGAVGGEEKEGAGGGSLKQETGPGEARRRLQYTDDSAPEEKDGKAGQCGATRAQGTEPSGPAVSSSPSPLARSPSPPSGPACPGSRTGAFDGPFRPGDHARPPAAVQPLLEDSVHRSAELGSCNQATVRAAHGSDARFPSKDVVLEDDEREDVKPQSVGEKTSGPLFDPLVAQRGLSDSSQSSDSYRPASFVANQAGYPVPTFQTERGYAGDFHADDFSAEDAEVQSLTLWDDSAQQPPRAGQGKGKREESMEGGSAPRLYTSHKRIVLTPTSSPQTSPHPTAPVLDGDLTTVRGQVRGVRGQVRIISGDGGSSVGDSRLRWAQSPPDQFAHPGRQAECVASGQPVCAAGKAGDRSLLEPLSAPVHSQAGAGGESFEERAAVFAPQPSSSSSSRRGSSGVEETQNEQRRLEHGSGSPSLPPSQESQETHSINHGGQPDPCEKVERAGTGKSADNDSSQVFNAHSENILVQWRQGAGGEMSTRAGGAETSVPLASPSPGLQSLSAATEMSSCGGDKATRLAEASTSRGRGVPVPSGHESGSKAQANLPRAVDYRAPAGDSYSRLDVSTSTTLVSSSPCSSDGQLTGLTVQFSASRHHAASKAIVSTTSVQHEGKVCTSATETHSSVDFAQSQVASCLPGAASTVDIISTSVKSTEMEKAAPYLSSALEKKDATVSEEEEVEEEDSAMQALTEESGPGEEHHTLGDDSRINHTSPRRENRQAEIMNLVPPPPTAPNTNLVKTSVTKLESHWKGGEGEESAPGSPACSPALKKKAPKVITAQSLEQLKVALKTQEVEAKPARVKVGKLDLPASLKQKVLKDAGEGAGARVEEKSHSQSPRVTKKPPPVKPRQRARPPPAATEGTAPSQSETRQVAGDGPHHEDSLDASTHSGLDNSLARKQGLKRYNATTKLMQEEEAGTQEVEASEEGQSADHQDDSEAADGEPKRKGKCRGWQLVSQRVSHIRRSLSERLTRPPTPTLPTTSCSPSPVRRMKWKQIEGKWKRVEVDDDDSDSEDSRSRRSSETGLRSPGRDSLSPEAHSPYPLRRPVSPSPTGRRSPVTKRRSPSPTSRDQPATRPATLRSPTREQLSPDDFTPSRRPGSPSVLDRAVHLAQRRPSSPVAELKALWESGGRSPTMETLSPDSAYPASPFRRPSSPLLGGRRRSSGAKDVREDSSLPAEAVYVKSPTPDTVSTSQPSGKAAVPPQDTVYVRRSPSPVREGSKVPGEGGATFARTDKGSLSSHQPREVADGPRRYSDAGPSDERTRQADGGGMTNASSQGAVSDGDTDLRQPPAPRCLSSESDAPQVNSSSAEKTAAVHPQQQQAAPTQRPEFREEPASSAQNLIQTAIKISSGSGEPSHQGHQRLSQTCTAEDDAASENPKRALSRNAYAENARTIREEEAQRGTAGTESGPGTSNASQGQGVNKGKTTNITSRLIRQATAPGDGNKVDQAASQGRPGPSKPAADVRPSPDPASTSSSSSSRSRDRGRNLSRPVTERDRQGKEGEKEGEEDGEKRGEEEEGVVEERWESVQTRIREAERKLSSASSHAIPPSSLLLLSQTQTHPRPGPDLRSAKSQGGDQRGPRTGEKKSEGHPTSRPTTLHDAPRPTPHPQGSSSQSLPASTRAAKIRGTDTSKLGASKEKEASDNREERVDETRRMQGRESEVFVHQEEAREKMGTSGPVEPRSDRVGATINKQASDPTVRGGDSNQKVEKSKKPLLSKVGRHGPVSDEEAATLGTTDSEEGVDLVLTSQHQSATSKPQDAFETATASSQGTVTEVAAVTATTPTREGTSPSRGLSGDKGTVHNVLPPVLLVPSPVLIRKPPSVLPKPKTSPLALSDSDDTSVSGLSAVLSPGEEEGQEGSEERRVGSPAQGRFNLTAGLEDSCPEFTTMERVLTRLFRREVDVVSQARDVPCADDSEVAPSNEDAVEPVAMVTASPSVRFLGSTMWEMSDSDRVLRAGRRLMRDREDIGLLEEISELEEHVEQPTSPDSRSLPPASPRKGDNSDGPRESRSRRRRGARRSLSLPSGTLSYGDCRILYVNGHFVREPLQPEDEASLQDVVDFLRSPSDSSQSEISWSSGGGRASRSSGSSLLDVGAELSMREDFLYLLDSQISAPDSVFSPQPLDWNYNHVRGGHDPSSPSVSSSVVSTLPRSRRREREVGNRPLSVDESQIRQNLALYGQQHLGPGQGPSVGRGPPVMRSQSLGVGDRADAEGMDSSLSAPCSPSKLSDGDRTKGKNPNFLQKILSRRKSFNDKAGKPPRGDSGQGRDVTVARKVSLRGLFRRKSVTDAKGGSSGGREGAASPPIAAFLQDEDIGAVSSLPGSPYVRRGHRGSVDTGMPEAGTRRGGDDDRISLRSLDISHPLPAPVSPPVPHQQPAGPGGRVQPAKPTSAKPETLPRRRRESSGSGRHPSVSLMQDRSSGEFSLGELDTSADYNDLDETLTPTSLSPSTSSSMTAEGDATLTATPLGADRTPGPGSLRPRCARQDSGSGLDKMAGVVRGEITASNSNDSGIQHDVNTHSSYESLKLVQDAVTGVPVNVKLRQTPSPKQERPKSDITVRWADLENSLDHNVAFLRDGNKLRKRPRPKSDLENLFVDEGLDYADEDEDEDAFDEYEHDDIREDLYDVEGGSSLFGEAMKAFSGSVGSLYRHDSLRSLAEMRRLQSGDTMPAGQRAGKGQKTSRRMSTPQPIKNRLERNPQRSKPKRVTLVRSHSMPENLDKLHKRRNFLSLIGYCTAGTDAISLYSHHSGVDDSSDESEYSLELSLRDKCPSTRSSQSALATLDELIEEENTTYAEALWDHVTMDPDELGFRAGDLIRVVDMTDKDWWFGNIQEEEGWFPASFVRLRVNQEAVEEEMTLATIEEVSSSPKLKHHASYINKDQGRTNVVNEIINAEREYVKHLRGLVEGYLKQAKKRPEMFSEDKVNTIFGNLEKIFSFAERFLAELELCISKDAPHNSEIGHVFLKHSAEFEIYSDYCNNHPAACEELKELYRNKRYKHFFEACRLLQEMIEIPLEGFLLTPVQKICKYHLQLAELLKYTVPEHPDRPAVQGALDAMRSIATLINERKRKMESIEKLTAWQLGVDDWEGPDLLDTSSELIYTGELNKINANGWSQERTFFLFDHQLIYCKRDILKKNSYGYKGRIVLDHSEIIPLDDGKDTQYNVTVRHAWKIHDTHRDKWFLLVAKSDTMKQRWLKAFQEERRRVKEDQENNFNIPHHLKQRAINNIKQKANLNKPKGKHKVRSSSFRTSKPEPWVAVAAHATLPRPPARKPDQLSNINQSKKLTWFFLGGKKGK